MNPIKGPRIIKTTLLICILIRFLVSGTSMGADPVVFTDDDGYRIAIRDRPVRVVSLVPSTTEIIFGIAAGDALRAITYDSTYPPETSQKEIIGSAFFPSLTRIRDIQPDIIFLSHSQQKLRERFGNGNCQLINLETNSIADSYRNIRLLGRIFNRENAAANIVKEIENQLQIIGRKMAKIPDTEKKRVIRIIGREAMMTPGDDSFQNEIIRAAGGIPPKLNKHDNIVRITKEEWVKFNPQVIYGCVDDRKTMKKFLKRPGWKDVAAVKNDNIYYFPCELTSRTATFTGYFVAWLASTIYADKFSNKEDQVLDEKVIESRQLELDLDYTKNTGIKTSTIYDFVNKTLIIEFNKPLSVVSTMEGQREGIESVGNHYFSPPCWGIIHKFSLKETKSRVYQVIGKSDDKASFLFTGADLDNLSITHKQFKDMKIYALVTAGVKSNAVRMSKDPGFFYEPGTINIILLSNMQLTNRAMTRAIISATEAKTAALMDMDIRSSYTPGIHRATGTGTDNIIVVQGDGIQIDNSGGHSKIGELIAQAVYAGVQEAVYKQNGLRVKRNIFQRLKERKINLPEMISGMQHPSHRDGDDLISALEETLFDPRYANFIESSFAINDDFEKGLITDLAAYKQWCTDISEEIAHGKIKRMEDFNALDDQSMVLRMALKAILNGVYFRVHNKLTSSN